MYTSFSSNRKNHKLTINGRKVNGKYLVKKLTKFHLDYIHHQIIQDVLDLNGGVYLSDFVLNNQRTIQGTFTKVARKYDISVDSVGRTFKKAFRLERLKLKNMGCPLPENQTYFWSRI